MEALGHVALPRFLKCAQHFPQSLAGFLKHVQHSPQSTLGHVVYGISIASASRRPESLVLTLPETLLAVFKEVVVSCSCLALIIVGREAIYCLLGFKNVFGWFVRFDQMVGRRRDLCCSVFAESGGEYRLML